MSCQVELFADCGDISSLGRALFIPEKEDTSWLTQCTVSLSPCGNLLGVGFRNRLCLLTSQWIRSTDRNSYLITWSGTMPANITSMLALSICPSHHSSQNGPDWFCIIVGFNNGSVGFYTNTGHQLCLEKLDETPVLKISCHTGSYGTLPDDVHVLFSTCVCILTGASLFQLLRNAKAQLAKVQAGIQETYSVDNRALGVRKWSFSEQEQIHDAAVVGLELKNSYDHLLAASTYGGYDTWYRSIPPMNTLILGAGTRPFLGFHYALEGGTAPPLQDVARAVANKIKSALPGWLGGGGGAESAPAERPAVRAEALSLRAGLKDPSRAATSVAVSPDRRLAAVSDSLGRVSVLDVARGHLVRLFKGHRDAQCAFLQVFEQDSKKPQLSVIKEVRRATFLIIYNPKKGLIDIRLMQRGNRVAVFTATKNGQLLYNTCGLVGAEKSYTHKKLNLPEFQCVLIDPDGKLKKFTVPFFYALEGEHSDRSKDLHILRDLREFVKKNLTTVENYENDIIEKAEKLKTVELQKHCLEMLVRNYEIPPKIVISCLTLFWENIEKLEKLTEQEEKIKRFFANLALLTLFYRNINNESTDDMTELMIKIYSYLKVNCMEELSVDEKQGDEGPDFHLLEDDNCILERLLILSQENGYKEHQPRVKFAENKSHKFKELVSCFLVEESSGYLSLKPELPQEKINKLSADVFKSVFEIKDIAKLSEFLKKSVIDPKEMVKLIIMHLMNMPLEEISIDLIEKLITVLYYASKATEEATKISYNEISPWWQSIRDLLVDMSCPLRSMIVAMACKSVGKIYEIKCSEGEEGAWESMTTENTKWGILIGKLEDISLLSIILMFKDKFDGNGLPKLQFDDISINLKYIYSRGKGSVTELIAKWLCSMGVVPEAVVANELMENRASSYEEEFDDDSASYPFIENNRVHVDNNPKIFKWLSLLRQQFPLSTSADYILANMCWEYAMAWQKDMQHTDKLNVVIDCLRNISDLHLRLGLFAIIWSTYIRHIFEASCKLVNKVGKMPKEPLCLQDVGFGNTVMVKFLETTTRYLDEFLKCSNLPVDREKREIHFEKIWDESTPSLMEVAQDTKRVNGDILSLNYQISCTIYYQCHFNVKCSKPLDTLYDIDYQYIFEALTGSVVIRSISMRGSEKLQNPRMKFVTKLVRAAVETVTASDDRGGYNSVECEEWMERVSVLAELWNIDGDFLKRQQVVGLYHLGYDTLAAETVTRLRSPEPALAPLLAISIQRLKRSLEHSRDQPEWIVCVPPHLYKRLQTTVLDSSIPAHPCLETTIIVLQTILMQLEKKTKEGTTDLQNIKIAQLIIESCQVLIRKKL
ncbi:rab3 GTPase-activating protein regulatory subunit isoform X1 [Leguminivora glycinivorella]|uniref:rab3 GTPase-activating protein regulatory subunit isoform X1 n=1 Tax=Leguminivora glycinivorella TaxID=1035111 RepID=UPI00200CB8C0|nr:rab3 GTPase-activating protein regulatory subunit isoform X1 [Leguminivora glycinivorella]